MTSWIRRSARATFFRALEGLSGGSLDVVDSSGVARFGRRERTDDLSATLVVENDRFYLRALTGGDVGLGESFMDGDWSSPDLVSLVRLAVRNLAALDDQQRRFGWARQMAARLAHRRRANTLAGSRRNIHAHYDLGNAFFRLFLDPVTLAYSCGYYGSPDDPLEQAQVQKFETICRKLDLQPGDRVLEIGTGWGGFAVHAATRHECHVTTTTISEEQHAHASAWIARAGLADRVTLLFEDYRHLTGCFDKIVSIEMFEAVGFEHYDRFFGACDRLLADDGVMLLQTITMNERTFPAYRGRADWIQRYIFPGGELASLAGILGSLGRATRLTLHHAENIGAHYALTLRAWRARFHERLDAVRRLGYDDRFIRMWDYYLAYCEGAFLERHIGDHQLVMARTNSRRNLVGEPCVVKGNSPRSSAGAAPSTAAGRI
jgi:cyclopropane-fatty-acyl-phospholipid synthase